MGVLSGSRTGRQPVPATGLTRGALEALLDQLDPDRERAALQYEKIRSKLIRLFEWRRCRHADELADLTIDRVAARLEGGVEIRAADPYRYFCGVAFNVFKEVLREQVRLREAVPSEGWTGREAPVEEEEEHPALPCLDACLQKMTSRSRQLVLSYHQSQQGSQIQNRKRLAEELGITTSSLRLRVHRLRKKLERCVETCRSFAAGRDGRRRFQT